MVPEDYGELADRLRALSVGQTPAAPAVASEIAVDVFRRVVLGVMPMAEALHHRSAQGDLSSLLKTSEIDGVDARPVRLLLRAVDAMADEARTLEERTRVLRTCVAEMLEVMGGLCEGEATRRERLVDLQLRISRASAIDELERLREALLSQAHELVRESAEREHELHLVRQQADRAGQLEQALLGAESRARTDALTRLGNRLALDEAAERFAEHGSETGVLVIDLDHFKAVNDTHGHAVGDDVLRWLAVVLKGELRGDDGAFRLGGEEFVVLLPDASWSGARAAAERLRQRIARQPVPTQAGELSVTASIGVSVWAPGSKLSSALAQADDALYRAKRSGRDRVVG